MLHEMIPAVERSLRLGLTSALLIFVRGHMIVVRVDYATEGTRIQRHVPHLAADPCGSKRVYRIFVPDPFIFCLEGSWAKCAEERQVFLLLACIVYAVELWTSMRRFFPSHTSPTTPPFSTKRRDVAFTAVRRYRVSCQCCALRRYNGSDK